MSFGQAIQTCMGKYATFAGRGVRSEFWWFYLFALLMSWGANVVGALALGGEEGAAMLGLIINLALFVPTLAASSRRLHDTNRSGWWFLLAFTVIGLIPLIIWWAQDSDKESNRFGEPLES